MLRFICGMIISEKMNYDNIVPPGLRLSQMLPLQWLPSHKNKQLANDMRLFQGTITKVLQDKLTSLSYGT